MTDLTRDQLLGDWYGDLCRLHAVERTGPTCPSVIIGWSLGWLAPQHVVHEHERIRNQLSSERT